MTEYVTLDEYKRPRMGLEPFGRDLAAALGFPVEVDSPGSSYPVVTVDCGEGLSLYLRGGYGAKMGKVEIGATTGAARNLDPRERPHLPSASVDSARDMAAIAKDVRRRVIDPARDLVAQTVAAASARAAKCDGLEAMAAELMAKYPGLSISTRANDLRADVYFSKAGSYLHGTIGIDGRIHVERLSIATSGQVEALFALISRNPSAEDANPNA